MASPACGIPISTWEGTYTDIQKHMHNISSAMNYTNSVICKHQAHKKEGTHDYDYIRQVKVTSSQTTFE